MMSEFKFTFQDCQELLCRGNKQLEYLNGVVDLYKESKVDPQKHFDILYRVLDLRKFVEEVKSIVITLSSKIEEFMENDEDAYSLDPEDVINNKLSIDDYSRKAHEMIMFEEWVAFRSMISSFIYKAQLISLLILLETRNWNKKG